jgi:uncharacterized protein (TIGR02996 family)
LALKYPDNPTLIAAILDDPTNRGARHDYADWLEERGDAIRSEIVRNACRLDWQPFGHRTDASTQLEKRQAELWLEGFRRWTTGTAPVPGVKVRPPARSSGRLRPRLHPAARPCGGAPGPPVGGADPCRVARRHLRRPRPNAAAGSDFEAP